MADELALRKIGLGFVMLTLAVTLVAVLVTFGPSLPRGPYWAFDNVNQIREDILPRTSPCRPREPHAITSASCPAMVVPMIQLCKNWLRYL